MKFLHLLPAIVITAFIFSCKKDNASPVVKSVITPATIAYVTDSCTYTIEGKRYTCDSYVSFGRGDAGAHLDSNHHWHSDSTQYHTEFILIKKEDGNKTDDGYIDITFIKNYSKNQLTKTWPINIAGPESENELYKKGYYKYALDYKRFNTQSGIAIDVINRLDGSSTAEHCITYIDAPAFSPTKIGANSQDNSKFEIVSFSALPDGSHLMEARFEANVFNPQELVKRLENGYIRIHVD